MSANDNEDLYNLPKSERMLRIRESVAEEYAEFLSDFQETSDTLFNPGIQ